MSLAMRPLAGHAASSRKRLRDSKDTLEQQLRRSDTNATAQEGRLRGDSD